MTDENNCTAADPLMHLDRFKQMAEERKADLDPAWHKGFGTAAVPFVAGIILLLYSWVWWGVPSYGDGAHDPVASLVLGVICVAVGLARRDVRVRVPSYGVVVDGQPVQIDWSGRLEMDRREASEQAMLKRWQDRHPGSRVELVHLWHAWVFVPRDQVEQAGMKNLMSR